MVSLQLLYGLARALPAAGRLILLGDRDQLASVEAGAVLGDICGPDRGRQYSGRFGGAIAEARAAGASRSPQGECQTPVGDCIVELRHNYRFGAESGIGALARLIKAAGAEEAPPSSAAAGDGDLGWRRLSGPRELSRALATDCPAGYGDYLAAETPAAVFENFSRFRVLCALRDGPYGAGSLNAAVEAVLAREGRIRRAGPGTRGVPSWSTRNDYGLRLFNGDIGIALADPESAGALRVFFPAPDGAMRKFDPYRLPEHETVFAMTIHKSQGTEFDRVLLVLPESDARVLTRELLYTGVTRARKRVDLWAGEAALRAALSRRIERASGLRDALWAEGTGNGNKGSCLQDRGSQARGIEDFYFVACHSSSDLVPFLDGCPAPCHDFNDAKTERNVRPGNPFLIAVVLLSPIRPAAVMGSTEQNPLHS